MIIGLGHQARVGKDAVAEILVEEHGFKRIGFADSLKRLSLLFNPIIKGSGQRLDHLVKTVGWEATKDLHPDARLFLQRVGGSVRTIFGEGCWVDVVREQMHRGNAFTQIEDDWVISDMRYENEVEYVKGNGGWTVNVRRPGIGAANGHISEHALDDLVYDFILDNDGRLEDLHSKVTFLLVQIQETIEKDARDSIERAAASKARSDEAKAAKAAREAAAPIPAPANNPYANIYGPYGYGAF